MPRFFFDCLIDGRLHRDEYGLILPDDEIVDQAQAVLAELIQDSLASGLTKSTVVTVRNEAGIAIYTAQCLTFQGYVKEGEGPMPLPPM